MLSSCSFIRILVAFCAQAIECRNAHYLDANVHNVDAQNVCENIAEKKFWKLDTVQQNKTRKVCTQTVGKSLRDRFFCEFLHSNVNNAIATL